jgi:hypothetical protein
MRQYAGFSTAEDSNKRYRYLLAQGQTGLSVAFDLPTQIGYDADDPIAAGEVGKVGVSISSIHDMAQLFDQIPLDKVSTSMTINAPAGVLLAMYIAVAKRQGADISKIRGTIQNDILKEYVARGTYIFPPAPSMRLITDIFQYCASDVPNWNRRSSKSRTRSGIFGRCETWCARRYGCQPSWTPSSEPSCVRLRRRIASPAGVKDSLETRVLAMKVRVNARSLSHPPKNEKQHDPVLRG